jgi:hypothetical protein
MNQAVTPKPGGHQNIGGFFFQPLELEETGRQGGGARFF